MPTPGSTSPSPNPSKPAFIIGVTGNTDPVGYRAADTLAEEPPAIQAVRRKIRAVLQWVRYVPPKEGSSLPSGWLDPEKGEFDPMASGLVSLSPRMEGARADQCFWNSLGLQETPIVVLSSLAPGIDTLFAEEALAYARESGANVIVRVPLPFPLRSDDGTRDVYRVCSSFFGSDSRMPDAAKQARLDALLERVRAQPGFCEERDLFPVALDKSLGGHAESDLTATDATGGNSRKLRYRAAGEYIAAQSDLLVAIYDVAWDKAQHQDPNDRYHAGTAAIVEAKRSGLSYRLLAGSNSFAWADNGPVLEIPIHRAKNGWHPNASQPCTHPLRVLHPYDLKPAPQSRDFDGKWLQNGAALFRRTLRYQEEINRLPVRADRERLAALEALVGPAEKSSADKIAAQEKRLREVLQEPGRDFAETVAHLAMLRRRVADQSNEIDASRDLLLWRMLILIAVAALCIGAFEHWHREPEEGAPQAAGSHATESPGDDPEPPPATEKAPPPWLTSGVYSWTRVGLLAAGFCAMLVSALLYYRHLKQDKERRRFDARAIAEGLRVQYYWCLSGTGRSVAADYMQRQRGELDWIRYVVSAVAFPVERWRRAFMALAPDERAELLEITHVRWVREQEAYYREKACVLHRYRQGCHERGWGFIGAGVISILGLLLAESPRLASYLLLHWPIFGGLLLVVGLLMLLPEIGAWTPDEACTEAEEEEHTLAGGTIFSWLFLRRVEWALALVFAGLVIGLPHAVQLTPFPLPDWHDCWIILTVAALLVGGLSFAWAERKLYSERLRRYRAMGGVFACADRRLEKLLKQLRHGEAASESTLEEIQGLLHALGCEQLDENAEWLIQHRARPLEPFMAS